MALQVWRTVVDAEAEDAQLLLQLPLLSLLPIGRTHYVLDLLLVLRVEVGLHEV